MNKYLLYMFLTLGTIQQFHSQESNGIVALALPVRNSLKFNRYAINPTFSFVREQNKYISFTNKRQWGQFSDAPQSYLFSYAGRFSENIGAGVGLFQQDFGVLTTFGGMVNFAYNASLNRDSNLTFGLNIGAYQSSINQGRVVVNTPDPSLQNVPSNFLLTINPGINYGTDFFDFGVAINNLVSYNLNDSQMIEDNPEQGLQAHAMYTGYMNTRGFFDESRFSTLIRSEFKKDQTVISGLAMINVPKGIWAQAGYNTLYGASAGLGLNVTNNIAIEYNYEQSMGNFSEFGSSHEITVAYRFNKKYRYSYGDEEEEKSAFNFNKRRAKPNNLTDEDRARIAERRAELAAKRKAEAEAKKAEAEVANTIEQDDVSKKSTDTNTTNAAEDSQLEAKAEKEKQLQLEAEKKAAAEEERIRLTEEKKRLEAEAKLKAEEETRKKQAEEKLKAETEARAKAEEEKRLEIEAEKRAKETIAKAEAEAEAKRIKAEEDERLRLEEQAKIEAQEEAERKIEEDKQLAEAAAKEKAEEERRRLEAEALKVETEKIEITEDNEVSDNGVNEVAEEIEQPVADDEASEAMRALLSATDSAKKAQNELIQKLSTRIDIKQKDLDDLKEENDLSEQGIYLEPKPFKSVSAENAAIEKLRNDIEKVEKEQEMKMIELEGILVNRKRKFKKDSEGINEFYFNALEQLKTEQLRIKRYKESLVSNLEVIKEATDFERKRRIRRAAYDNQQDRYNKDKAALERIKKFTTVATEPYKEEDFDFGEEQTNNIQIIKNVMNEEPGYYMVIAVHNSVEKRDDFLTKVIASGGKDVNFFFDVKTNKYFIYSKKFDAVNQAQTALDEKSNKPYNSRMSLVKIEK